MSAGVLFIPQDTAERQAASPPTPEACHCAITWGFYSFFLTDSLLGIHTWDTHTHTPESDQSLNPNHWDSYRILRKVYFFKLVVINCRIENCMTKWLELILTWHLPYNVISHRHGYGAKALTLKRVSDWRNKV